MRVKAANPDSRHLLSASTMPYLETSEKKRELRIDEKPRTVAELKVSGPGEVAHAVISMRCKAGGLLRPVGPSFMQDGARHLVSCSVGRSCCSNPGALALLICEGPGTLLYQRRSLLSACQAPSRLAFMRLLACVQLPGAPKPTFA